MRPAAAISYKLTRGHPLHSLSLRCRLDARCATSCYSNAPLPAPALQRLQLQLCRLLRELPACFNYEAYLLAAEPILWHNGAAIHCLLVARHTL